MWTIVISIVVTLVVLLVVLALVLGVLGRSIPVEHEAKSEIELRAPIAEVFAIIEDASSHASWAPGITRVERVEDGRAGHPAHRLHMGRNSFVLETTVCEPPRKLYRTIRDDNGPFSGSWEYTLVPTDAGCRVQLKELGRIAQPIPRAMMKYIFGYHMYINKHLGGLARHLGQGAAIRKL